MRRLTLLITLATLTACDKVGQNDVQTDRGDRSYRSAMADYHAGRMEAAIKGFRSVIEANPANASARFQYACLMQDVKKNYREAFCAYSEYLLQQPKSDKAAIARDRLALCEKELARQLAERHGLIGNADALRELERVRVDLMAAGTRTAAAEKDASALRSRVEALLAERERLVSTIKGDDLDAAELAPKTKVSAKDLLEEEESTDRIKMSEDVAQLRAEAEADLAGTTLLPKQTSADVARHEAAEKGKKEMKAREEAARRERDARIPKTYIVEDGDTLFRIAERFYGTISAWRKIRDANKAIISADGRVRAGDTITLPRP